METIWCHQRHSLWLVSSVKIEHRQASLHRIACKKCYYSHIHWSGHLVWWGSQKTDLGHFGYFATWKLSSKKSIDCKIKVSWDLRKLGCSCASLWHLLRCWWVDLPYWQIGIYRQFIQQLHHETHPTCSAVNLHLPRVHLRRTEINNQPSQHLVRQVGPHVRSETSQPEIIRPCPYTWRSEYSQSWWRSACYLGRTTCYSICWNHRDLCFCQTNERHYYLILIVDWSFP